MKMSIDHLPSDKQSQLRQAMDIIVRTVKPGMLILFGSYARGDWVEELEPDGEHYRYQSDFDLLAIVRHSVQARKIELNDSLDSRLLQEVDTPVSLIAEDIDFVNARLRKGQYFFKDVVQEGVLLHDNGKFELAEPKELTLAERRGMAKQDFEYWFGHSNILIENYRYNLKQGTQTHYNWAAFFLHQITEQIYSAILLVFTRYKPKTHDLKKLRALTASVEPAFLPVFPQGTAEERARFKLLRHAYVDARYNPDYRITREQLEWLAERVSHLEALARQLCQKKIESFG